MRDLGSYITLKRLIAEATLTTSPAAVVIDRATINNSAFFEGLTFGFHVGAGGITFNGTNYLALKIEESDDNVTYNVAGASGSPVTVLGASVTGLAPWFGQAPDASGFVRLINAAHATADADPFKVSYVGAKRYVRATIVFGGTHSTGTLVGLTAVLGYPSLLPAP
jgi:hypothetical protein